MRIYRPLISNRLTQAFGENKACINPATGAIRGKTNGTCPVGYVEFYPYIGMKGHSGLDFSAWHGEKIYHAATFDGWMKVEKDAQGGIGVDVISNEPINGTYMKCRYWHLKAPVGHDGKKVTLGQVVGLADNTGASSGDHLHFGLKPCDKDGNSKEKGNGYYGAINPKPYMDIDTDAKTAAEYLNVPPPALSSKEREEMNAQLSSTRRLLLSLLELSRKL